MDRRSIQRQNVFKLEFIRAQSINIDDQSQTMIIQVELSNKSPTILVTRRIHVQIQEVTTEIVVASGDIWDRFVFPGVSLSGSSRSVTKNLALKIARTPVFSSTEQYRVNITIDLADSKSPSIQSMTTEFVW